MKKALSLLLAAAFLIGTLTGCGSTNAGSSTSQEPEAGSASVEDASTGSQPEETEVKHVIAATSGKPKPFIYTDDDGNLTGYEAEVLYAVDELLEDYEFEIEIAEFAAVLTGIEAGIYDLGFNRISRTEEREETYLYGDEFVGYSYTGAVVRIDDDSIQTLADLGGKTAPSKVSGSPTQLYMEAYNEANPDNAIDLIYTTAEDLKVVQDLVDGVYDFNFLESTVYESYLEEYPELAETTKFITFTPEETAEFEGDSYSWFLFQQTDAGAELAQAVDGALRQLKEDGTLNAIAQEYLHYDVVQ